MNRGKRAPTTVTGGPKPRFRRLTAHSWLLAGVLVSPLLLSCTSWRLQQISPAQLISEKQPSKIRVTRSDGTRIVLTQPRLSGDSLIGSAIGYVSVVPPEGGARVGVSTAEPLGIPLADVAGVSVRRTNAWLTSLLVLGVFAAGGAVFLINLANSQT